MTLSDADLSRVVSHALRHEPWLYELELDEDGWAPVEQLLTALRERRGDWESVDRDALGRMIGGAAKRRHELDGDQIRALYGHSVPGRMRQCPAKPPRQLFHGTAPETWETIRAEGLRPMRRRFVHMSIGRETALMVGQRKSTNPVLLVIEAAAAAASGTRFYEGNETVWLADSVPALFIDAAGSQPLRRVGHAS